MAKDVLNKNKLSDFQEEIFNKVLSDNVSYKKESKVRQVNIDRLTLSFIYCIISKAIILLTPDTVGLNAAEEIILLLDVPNVVVPFADLIITWAVAYIITMIFSNDEQVKSQLMLFRRIF